VRNQICINKKSRTD